MDVKEEGCVDFLHIFFDSFLFLFVSWARPAPAPMRQKELGVQVVGALSFLFFAHSDVLWKMTFTFYVFLLSFFLASSLGHPVIHSPSGALRWRSCSLPHYHLRVAGAATPMSDNIGVLWRLLPVTCSYWSGRRRTCLSCLLYLPSSIWDRTGCTGGILFLALSKECLALGMRGLWASMAPMSVDLSAHRPALPLADTLLTSSPLALSFSRPYLHPPFSFFPLGPTPSPLSSSAKLPRSRSAPTTTTRLLTITCATRAQVWEKLRCRRRRPRGVVQVLNLRIPASFAKTRTSAETLGMAIRAGRRTTAKKRRRCTAPRRFCLYVCGGNGETLMGRVEETWIWGYCACLPSLLFSFLLSFPRLLGSLEFGSFCDSGCQWGGDVDGDDARKGYQLLPRGRGDVRSGAIGDCGWREVSRWACMIHALRGARAGCGRLAFERRRSGCGEGGSP
ncbi:hypothetical protein DFH06DRAFT_534342 [Mycena polygramma]|nr:hypothetical protein DFH06DRAFT_534342 [Mycena polygramma]